MSSKLETGQLLVPTSPGELIDKITILEIKSERISDEAKLVNVRTELAILTTLRSERLPASAELDRLSAELKAVNASLWVIEDEIRDEERAKRFGDDFIRLARSVYVENDKRASFKKQINILLGSQIVEEKSYQPY